MRWPIYLILVYIAIGLQVGAGAFMRFGAGMPNLVLLAVIFIAINAPRDAALLGAFGIGVMQDLVSLQPLGLHALAYSLVAMFVVSTQELVYRGHPATNFSLGLIGGLLAGAVELIHGWIRGPRVLMSEVFLSALLTAVAAPFVLGLLHLARRSFNFRRRARGM